MTRKEAIPFVLVMFTISCALPATVISPPSAIAQEDDDEEENLASDTVSNVLDNGNTAGDNTNTQLSVPLTDQDQTDANLGLSEALDVTVERTLSTPPDDDGELPPECSLEITTDKETYGPGDTVAITIINTGDIPIAFPNSFLGLEIRNVDTEEVFPLDATPGVFTFGPGASATFEFTYEELVSEIGTGLISATVPTPCDTVEEVTFTLSAPPPPPPIPTEFCLTVEFTSTVVETYCFSTEEECETGEEILRGSFAFARILSPCAGFETLPAAGQPCEVAISVDPETGLVDRNISCPRAAD